MEEDQKITKQKKEHKHKIKSKSEKQKLNRVNIQTMVHPQTQQPQIHPLTQQPQIHPLISPSIQSSQVQFPIQSQQQNMYLNQQQNLQNNHFPYSQKNNPQIINQTDNQATNFNKNNTQNYPIIHNNCNCGCNHNQITNYNEDINMLEENQNNIEKKELIQGQISINKQLMKLKVAEEYTNDMLGRALSKAEFYSSRYGKKSLDNKMFNYYNRFDNGFNKEKENLIKSFINALDTLQDYYEEDGKNKRFPANFKKEQIIHYIKYLRDNCNDNDINKKYFDDFIKIINGKKVNFTNFVNSQNAVVDPKILITSGISSMKFVERQEKEWKENFKKNGDYPVELKFGINWEKNKNIPESLKYIDCDN